MVDAFLDIQDAFEAYSESLREEDSSRDPAHQLESMPRQGSLGTTPYEEFKDVASFGGAQKLDLRAAFEAKLQRVFLKKKLWGPRQVMLKDKLSFVLGCTMLWVCAFWLGRSPETFYQLYTFLGLILFPVRFFTFRRKRQHYYLFDFCYWANLLLLVQLWMMPRWQLLRLATFAFNTGPMTWSILAFRNSLVFHDLEKVTSLFLHLMPALVSWTLRWHPEGKIVSLVQATLKASPVAADVLGLSEAEVAAAAPTHCVAGASDPTGLWAALLCNLCGQWTNAAPHAAHTSAAPAADGDQSSLADSMYGLVAIPMALYIAWACFYYLEIFVFNAKKIQQRGYHTLFKYVTSQKRGAFHAISQRIPVRLHPQVYLLLHLCFTFCTLVLSVPCWHVKIAHTALLAAMASAAIWAGASYYFEIFATRYHAAITEAINEAEGKQPLKR